MTQLHSRLFLRTLSRNGDVYLLKIVTLAVAFATSILLILFSIHEFGYDTHYADAKRVFRILSSNADKDYQGNRLSTLVPGNVLNRISSILKDSIIISRVKPLKRVTVLAESNRAIYDQRIYAADLNVDKIFSLDIKEGVIDSFKSSSSNTALLSERAALQYFNGKSAIGKTIQLTTMVDTFSVVIAAVFSDLPSNSHERFDFFIHYDSSAIATLKFDLAGSGAYARLVSEKHMSRVLDQISTTHIKYIFQPVTEIYFGPRVLYEEARHGDMYSMMILISIVSLIFLLALCSFVNLSTITLPYRSKEIAVKKLAGTTQRQLLLQFVSESFTLTTISLTLAIGILLASSRYVSSMLRLEIIQMFMAVSTVFFVVTILMIVAVVIAPVFMAIRFVRATPTRLLSTDKISFPRFKRVITIVQFGVSLFLIVSSNIVRRQINYSLIKEPGRNHDQVVYIACPVNISDSAIHKLRSGWPDKNPRIIDAMAVSQLPGLVKSKDVGADLFVLQVDWNFIDFFQLKMQEGRWFEPTDNDSAMVLNKMALKTIAEADKTVIGVVQDLGSIFNEPEQPVKIILGRNASYNWLCVRVAEADIRRTVQWIEKRMHDKGSRGKATFLNASFESWVVYQDQLNVLSTILTVVSALLAGCAIYGLTVSLVRDKLREIAVHQLLGARTADITRLIAGGLLRDLAIAVLFFGPVTYLLLIELLKTFVYSTKLTWVDPVYPVGYCLFVIIGLCAYQAISLNRGDFASALKGRT